MTVRWIGWDVDLTWYNKKDNPDFERVLRSHMLTVAKRDYDWNPNVYDRRLKALKEENYQVYCDTMRDISLEAMKYVPKAILGTKRFKRALRDLSDYKHFIITNNLNGVFEDILCAFGIERELFDVIITSDTIHYRNGNKYFSRMNSLPPKPSVRPFQYIVKRNRTFPERHVFVGDSYENDIRPASESGMKTIWVWKEPPSKKDKYKAGVSEYASKMEEIPLIIRKL